ncbi:acetyl esterase [Fusarium albosuccineum]|uniref:Acetyl esterase n=1 Tax=Fusarium albosuccineum TaxID=1237068 RepID=A0A8H4LEF7_9HYPO|nr:acetyl esterase [Fusarium albosuccineum]
MLMLSVAALVSLATAKACGLKKFENFVTFGDSLTDDTRGPYFLKHEELPPPGVVLPVETASSGGAAWGRVVANTTGANYVNYAVQGATCDAAIVQQRFDLMNISFPSILDYELPAFKADLEFKNVFPNRQPDNTVYTLWIGANDLGEGGFFNDAQAPGATLTNVTDCFWGVFDHIYATGGRYFVVNTQAPIYDFPLYRAIEDGGPGNNSLWLGKSNYNTTALSEKMRQYVTSINTITKQGAAFHLKVQKRWPGATFVVFDAHQVLLDILANLEEYLDAPADVLGVYNKCKVEMEDCTPSEKPMSSFAFYDELHISERVSEVVAEKFVEAINGKSKYATYWS